MVLCIKNSIGQCILSTLRDNFRPPKNFRKEIDNILLYFCVHFRGVFVLYVVTKIWPKIDFYRYSYNVEERAAQRAIFAHLPFTTRSDRYNLSCSFLELL